MTHPLPQGNRILICEPGLDAPAAQPNPALELLDVVQFNDGTGNVQTRATELHLTYMPQDGHYDLIFIGEGV